MNLAAPRRPSAPRLLLVSLAAALLVPGCAGSEEPLEQQQQAAVNTNGFRMNGFRMNGFRMNGFRMNGFRMNGFRMNGLATNGDFADWFNNADGGDRGFHAEVMSYMIACALRPDQQTSYTDSAGKSYSWTGSLGLAPSWMEPGVSTEGEKQLVTACLMSHANSAYPEPKHIMISLRGDAPGLETTPAERDAIATYDGTFFGDLFGDTAKMYICRAPAAPQNYVSTLLKDWGRQCFFTNDGCAGAFEMVDCATACGNAPAGVGYPYSATCTVDGKSYRSINTYVPKYKKALELSRFGVATTGTCANCLDNRMVKNMNASTSGVKLTGFVANSGTYVMDVRYANGGTTAASMKVEVGTTTVMNGASATWDFPPTGGADVWATRSISLTVSAGQTITLRGTNAAAPTIDAVSLRF